MATDAIAAQRLEYASATVAESWDAQLAALGATVWWSHEPGYLAAFGGCELVFWDVIYRWVLELLHTIRSLPRLEILMPVPGTARRGSLAPQQAGNAAPDQRILDRAKNHGFSTVVGFARDVEAVELLFTSLLIQATAAMTRAGSRVDGVGRSRTRSFRQSFLHAYAVRIGQRLTEATDEAGRAAAADTGAALVPVLAAKQQAVREAADSLIGETVQRQFSVGNHDGWISGTVAADLANVSVHRSVRAAS